MYYDAVNYHSHGLKNVESLVSRDRIMFGTDNPFFPPLDGTEKPWKSVESNIEAITTVFGNADDIFHKNATRLLDLQ